MGAAHPPSAHELESLPVHLPQAGLLQSMNADSWAQKLYVLSACGVGTELAALDRCAGAAALVSLMLSTRVYSTSTSNLLTSYLADCNETVIKRLQSCLSCRGVCLWCHSLMLNSSR